MINNIEDYIPLFDFKDLGLRFSLRALTLLRRYQRQLPLEAMKTRQQDETVFQNFEYPSLIGRYKIRHIKYRWKS